LLKKEFLLSIVVPVYNEEGNLQKLYDELIETISTYNYEIIFVNDGSMDASKEIIQALILKDSRIKLIDFSRNFGHEAATSAGVIKSKGNAVVIIDADLQDPPELIHKMVDKWQQGYQVVYAIRGDREGEKKFKKFTSSLFYKIMDYMADIQIPRNTGDFRLIDEKVVADFRKLKEKNRFFRGLICWVGYKQTGITFDRLERFSGQTKYNYLKLFRLAMDSITSFSVKPLQVITLFGVILSSISFLLILIFIVIKLFLKFPVSGWTSLIITILFFSGIQIFIIGIVSEYISRMFIEIKNRPLYLIDKIYSKEEKDG